MPPWCAWIVAVALAIAAAWAAPRAILAQTVRGIVRDSVSRLPMGGAVASVFDSANQVITRTLTVADGRFALTASHAPRRLQVLHIGHLPVELRLPAPGADGSITIDVVMGSLPTHLDAMRSTRTPLCPRPLDQGAGFALWEQARAEFLAAIVARDATNGAVRVLFYDRDIDPDTRRVIRQTTSLREGPSSKTSVAARSAAVFAERGYLDTTDTARFYGPDADVLLDEAFATTHCFHIQRGGSAHAHDIGVAFVPAHERPRVAEIAGVLWIDSSAHAIRALEYRYTNLRPAYNNGPLGGSVTFRVLRSGAPVIERWVIQTSPSIWANAGSMRGAGRIGGAGLIGGAGPFRESGTELLEGTWADSVRWKASLGTVVGRVRPSKNVSLPERTVVSFAGTDYTAVSDSSGAFQFTQLLPGRYTIQAVDKMVASFGLDQTDDAPVDVFRDSVVRLDVRLTQTPLQALARPCSGTPSSGASDLLVRVQSQEGAPVTAMDGRGRLEVVAGGPGKVGLETFILAGRGIEVPVLTAPLNRALGSFVVCGVPWGSRLRLRALVGYAATEQETTLPSGNKIDTLTLILGAVALSGRALDSKDPFTNSDFVHVRPGTFSMGSTSGSAAERPVHTVTLTHGYWLERYLVTQAQWQSVMGTNPSLHKDCPTCPVENVSFDQVRAFISALNELSPEKKYRMPTEAEWEFAARTEATGGPGAAGSVTLRSWMAVNVFEWVADWYGSYPSTPVTDPTGPASAQDCRCRVLRGGSYDDAATYLRSWSNVRDDPAVRFPVTIGFRLARSE